MVHPVFLAPLLMETNTVHLQLSTVIIEFCGTLLFEYHVQLNTSTSAVDISSVPLNFIKDTERVHATQTQD